MRRSLVASILLALVSPALAQDDRWIEPGGRYTLQDDHRAWRREEPPSDSEFALELRGLGDNGVDNLHRCGARQVEFTLVADPDQRKLNAYVEVAYSAEGAAAFFRDAQIGEVSHRLVNDVRVADIELVAITPGPKFRVRYRIFVLEMGGGLAVYHELRCTDLMPVSIEDARASDAFLASLQFHRDEIAK